MIRTFTEREGAFGIHSEDKLLGAKPKVKREIRMHARTQLTITHATISEHVDPTATVAASSIIRIGALLR